MSNLLEHDRLPRNYKDEAFSGISLVAESFLLLTSNVLNSNNNVLRTQLAQDIVVMCPGN